MGITSGRGLITPSPINQTQTDPTNAASVDTRDVSRGATTLYSVLADNQKAAASNTKVWVKLFDDISNAWVPGTTKAKLGFPVEAWTSADDSQLIGTYQLMHSRSGVLFENGISVAVTKEAGDQAVAAPGTNVRVELNHS